MANEGAKLSSFPEVNSIQSGDMFPLLDGGNTNAKIDYATLADAIIAKLKSEDVVQAQTNNASKLISAALAYSMNQDILQLQEDTSTEQEEKSATAEIVTVNDADGGEADLTLNLEPHQDMNGYDHPWVGGTGKNLLPPLHVTSNTSNGITWVSDGNGTVTANGTATADSSFGFVPTNTYVDLPNTGVTYIATGCPSGGSTSKYLMLVYKYLDGDYIGSINELGSGITVDPTDGTFNQIRIILRVKSGQTVSNLTFKPMLRLASETDATYEPYSNICPISGHDVVNVVRYGKNLIDLDAFTAGGINNTGLPDSTSGRIVDTEPIIINDSLSYTISAQYAESAYDLRIIYAVWNDDTLVRRIANVSIKNTSATLNVSGGNKLYICLYCDQSHPIDQTSVSELQLEIGTTKTAYTPFVDRTTYLISLTAAGTVYGGTLDVTTGELVVDKGYITVGDRTWTYDSSQTRFYTAIPGIITGVATRRTPFICSAYQSIDDGRTLGNVPDGSIYGAGNTATVYIVDTRYTDPATFKSEMGDVQIVYPLNTPVTYQLTPTEVTILLGNNTIWMNADGTIKLDYKTNAIATKGDVNEVAIALRQKTSGITNMISDNVESSYIATKNYAVGEYFAVGTTLYKATAAITSGATITPNTNAQEVSITDQITTLNSTFALPSYSSGDVLEIVQSMSKGTHTATFLGGCTSVPASGHYYVGICLVFSSTSAMVIGYAGNMKMYGNARNANGWSGWKEIGTAI